MLVGLTNLVKVDEVSKPESLIAMNGTSNSLNFRAKVDGYVDFTYEKVPFINENAGRLILQTSDVEKLAANGDMNTGAGIG